MYKKLHFLSILVVMSLAAAPPAMQAQVENLVLNPSFEEDEPILDDPAWEQWCTWNPAEGAGSSATVVDTDAIDGVKSLRIDPKGATNWYFIVLFTPLSVDMSKDYTVSFWARAQEPRPLTMQMKASDNSVNAWGATTFDLTTEWAEYTYTSNVLHTTVKLEILCAGSEVPLWLDFVFVYEGEYVPGMGPGGMSPSAHGPAPSDGSVLDETSAALEWQPGVFAASHNMFFGESFEDVDQGLAEAISTTETSLSTADIAAYAGGLTPGQTYYWRVDEVNDVHPESPWRGDIWNFRVRPLTTWNPSPADGISYVRLDEGLSWETGMGVLFHTVYFSQSFDDVNEGVGGGYMIVNADYDPGPLEIGATYYWRVDEFDGAATHMGEIWSFTTVPEIQVGDPDLIGWWTLDEGEGTTAVDWSGHGNHGAVVGSPQWTYGVQGGALALSDGTRVEMPALNVETNTVTMTAWVKRQGNQSDWAAVLFSREGSGVSGMGFGPSNELRYHWMDSHWDFATGIVPPDREWFFMALVVEPTQATLYYNGAETFARNEAAHDPDPFDGTLMIGRDAQGGRDLAGTVDDVRFYNKALSESELLAVMRGDPLLAWNPSPAPDEVVDIRAINSLSWSAGDTAASHNVYFGTDAAAVAAAGTDTAEHQGNQAGTVFSVAGLVALGGGDYFWRIDEVAADETVQTGTVWRFTAPAYLLVDDFESYTNEVGSRVFEVWVDGLGFTQPLDTPGNDTGALVGHDIWAANTPYTTIMETGIVHGGGQSMPLYYDNTTAPYRSEADRTWLVAENWQVEGVTDLTLYVRGESDNDAAPVYVVIEDSAGNVAAVPHEDAAATTATDWIEWNIPLADLTAAGVNVASVRKMSIGVGSRTAPTPGGTGLVYIDDVRVTATTAGQ